MCVYIIEKMSLRKTLLSDNDEQQRFPSEAEQKKLRRQRSRVLWRLNVAGAALHGASFIAALVVSIIYASQSFQTELTTDFRYDERTTQLRSLGYYSIIWVDLPFPLITCLFHAAIAFVPSVWHYYRHSVIKLDRGNALRWLEYSITASLMTWVILQLSGVTNVLTLIVVGVLANIALQWQGHLQERLQRRSWVPTAVGWIIFMGQWTIILTYFFTLVTSIAAPWFVYVIVIGLFFLFAVFGLIQFAYMMEWIRSAYVQEICYLVMSLTAKLFLTWNLLIGIATR